MVKSEYPPRAPSPGALTFRVVEPATCRSGERATFTVEMQNATSAPVTVDFENGCLNWDTQADDGKHFTLEGEYGGLCGMEQRTLRVTLEPGGVVHKKVSLTATMQRVTDDGKEQTLGPLPPGRYRMTITLPWTDNKPIPGNDQARASRVLETPLIVTP